MWENVEHLAQGKGVFVLLPLAFIAFGAAIWISTLIDLIKGGSRFSPLSAPAPGDRLFFLLNLIGITGWLSCMLLFFLDTLCGADHHFASGALVMLAWGIGAFGIGGVNVFRYDTMVARRREGAKSATGPRRWFYAMAAQRYNKEGGGFNAVTARVIGGLFMVIGMAIVGGAIVMWAATGPEMAREIHQIVTALWTGQVVRN